MVYISEFDVVGEGFTIYHVNKVIAETGQIIDDGTKQIYVNTAVDDGTDIAELMSCFTKREFVNPKFPKLSAEVKSLKSIEGGLGTMSKVMEYIENIGRQQGIARGRILTFCELVHDGCLSIADAARRTGESEEEFAKELEEYIKNKKSK